MEYINLHVSVLDSEEFKGSTPTARATWLCLLRYLVGQEDGAKIEKCAAWTDRKWQQVCAVTLTEVQEQSGLWQWLGDDLEVNFYPFEAEKETRAKRRGGRLGNRRRWGGVKRSDSDSDTDSESLSVSTTKRNETEPNGSEGAHAPEVEVPSKAECVAWARTMQVDPEWAALKWENTNGTHGWERNRRLIDWRRLWPVWYGLDVRRKRWKPSGPGQDHEKNGGGVSVAQTVFKLDAKIKELTVQREAFEDTQPDLVERLSAELEQLQAKRRELAA